MNQTCFVSYVLVVFFCHSSSINVPLIWKDDIVKRSDDFVNKFLASFEQYRK